MPAATDPGRRANRTGSLWMIMAMAFFALEDTFLKFAAGPLPAAQVLIFFGTGGVLIFGLFLRARGKALFTAAVVSPPMLCRVVFEVFGRLFYILAISLTPLSSATVILQATPIMVVAGAAVFFGETVGWRRSLAIVIGLAGVFVIVGPTSGSFTWSSLLAVFGMLGFAGRDLTSRAAPASLSTAALGLYGFMSVILAGVLLSFWEGRAFVLPDAGTCGFLGAATLAGVAAYAGLMRAMRTGDVSAVTPFRYTRLIFGIVLGVVVFGEALDMMMILGSGLIVLSGVFILWRVRPARAVATTG